MKKIITFMGLLMFSSAVLAGGSIFGGHKSRTSNPEGVSSIGLYICGSLNCPDVILQTGDCFTVPNATVKYGVCVCDEGYVAQGEKCVKVETGVPTIDGWTDDESGADCSDITPPIILSDTSGATCTVCLKTGDGSDWFNTNTKCGTDESCFYGVCEPNTSEDGQCTKNSDCKNQMAVDGITNCGVDGCFCKYDGRYEGVEWSCRERDGKCVGNYPSTKGKCFSKQEAKGNFGRMETETEDGYIRSSIVMNWFSAQNFCHSYKKNLATLSDLGLPEEPCGTHCNIEGEMAININNLFWSDGETAIIVWINNTREGYLATTRLAPAFRFSKNNIGVTGGTTEMRAFALCK